MITLNSSGTIKDIISQIKSNSENQPLVSIVFMASTSYNFLELTKTIHNEFPDTEVLGCTTSGEISKNQLLNNSVSIVLFPKSIGKVSSVVVPNISDIPMLHYKKVKKAIENVDIDLNNPTGVALVFSTGLNKGEEKMLSVIDSLFPEKKLKLIGGSAGDDLKFEQTFVSLNGEIWDNASVCLFINSNKFEIFKENIFDQTGRRMQVTKSIPKSRTVYEFDNIKASKRYSDILNISEYKLANYFGKNPLGLIQGEDIFIRSPHTVNKDGSITFYSQLHEGAIVDILSLVNPIEVLKTTLVEIQSKFKRVDAVLGINCILRTLQFNSEKIGSEFCKTISNEFPNFTGFTSYGEQIGSKSGFIHLNQTLTLLVCGEKNNEGEN